MDATFNKFQGDVKTDTVKYLADPQLRNIVNVSVALGRPLLVKGEPGTGKTMLAHAIAINLNKRLIIWNIKSTTEAIDGCYMYDTVQRLNDGRFGCEDRDVNNIHDYITFGPYSWHLKHLDDVTVEAYREYVEIKSKTKKVLNIENLSIN